MPPPPVLADESGGNGSELRVKTHCHSSCSSSCSSCYKRTRSGLNYGVRCQCIEKAGPAAHPAKSIKSICKEYVGQHWRKEQKWLVLLMLVLVGLTLCTVVVLAEDKLPGPVHAVQKCLHALWWSFVALARTAVAVLTYLFKGLFVTWKGVKYGGGKLTHVIPQPSSRDLVKPLKFSKGQIKHLHHFNEYVIERMFSASKGVAKASGSAVKISALYVWKGSVASWRLFLRCGQAFAKSGRFLMKEERSIVSATKKDFAVPFRFSKKLGIHTASAGKKGIQFPWRFSKTLGKHTASAGKKGFKLPWKLSRELGKQTASAGKKGVKLPWRFSKTVGKQAASAGRKGVKLPWKFSTKLGKQTASAGRKGVKLPWRFSRELGKHTASAGKKGVKLPWKFSRDLGKQTASAGRKGVKLPWRFSKTLGKHTASAGKKGVKLPWKFSRELGEQTASVGKKGVKLPWRFSKGLGKQTASAGKKGVVRSWRFSEKHGAETVSATKKGFRMPWRFSIKQRNLTVPDGKKAIVISRRFSKKHGGKTASVIKKGSYTLLNRRQKMSADQKTSSFVMKCLFPLRKFLRWKAKLAAHEHAAPVIMMQAALGIFNGLVTLGVLLQYFLTRI